MLQRYLIRPIEVGMVLIVATVSLFVFQHTRLTMDLCMGSVGSTEHPSIEEPILVAHRKSRSLTVRPKTFEVLCLQGQHHCIVSFWSIGHDRNNERPIRHKSRSKTSALHPGSWHMQGNPYTDQSGSLATCVQWYNVCIGSGRRNDPCWLVSTLFRSTCLNNNNSVL